MVKVKECNPKEHDWHYNEPDGVYRICWECTRKESLQWMKHND